MISYPVYKVIHLVGIMMVFLSLGGITMHVINGGSKAHAWKKPLMITHGIGLLFSLVGGFGLLARIGVMHGTMPAWAILKLEIWGVFAIAVSLITRKQTIAKPMWVLILLLGGFAAYLAGSKPMF